MVSCGSLGRWVLVVDGMSLGFTCYSMNGHHPNRPRSFRGETRPNKNRRNIRLTTVIFECMCSMSSRRSQSLDCNQDRKQSTLTI